MSAAPLDLLRAELESYFATIARQRDPHPPSLLPHFAALDAWEAQWSSQVDPQLRHYLQKKSYQKALAHLKGETVEGHS